MSYGICKEKFLFLWNLTQLRFKFALLDIIWYKNSYSRTRKEDIFMNILVVDNNEAVLSFMEESLSSNGNHTVRTAPSSLGALKILDSFTPDIMFVDLIMPEIDGERFIKIARRRKELQYVFIVIVSAIAAEDLEGKYHDIADAYMAKMPFRVMKDYLQQLLTDIENNDVEKYRQRIIGREEIYKREITSELLYSKQHLDIILSRMSDGIVELKTDGKIIYANEAAQRLFTQKETSLLGQDFISIFPPTEGIEIKSFLIKIQNNRESRHEVLPIQYNSRFLTFKMIPIEYERYSSILLVIEDVTEKKEAEAINKLLRDKEILIREVQHRVKNNLQLITSLLNLQAAILNVTENGINITENGGLSLLTGRRGNDTITSVFPDESDESIGCGIREGTGVPATHFCLF
jgi:PAS domain S-box-containing protein